jgi:hypothetical protein
VRAEIEQLRDARMMLNRAITESRVSYGGKWVMRG